MSESGPGLPNPHSGELGLENIQVFLYVDNITDEDYFQGGFSNTESLGAGSFVLGAPRSYGIEAYISF